MKLSANDIILKVLGVLLLTAAGLKGYELLTIPTANADIWSNRNFLIFTVEFELALGIWLVSGVFRRIAWLAGIICFSLFCCVTLYKALAGFGSCGCFGKVHVNPWMTLLAIDIPAVVALLFVKPKNIRNVFASIASTIYRSLVKRNASATFKDMAGPRLTFVSSFTILLILTSSIVLAVNEPAVVTSSYEVLEPETWVGKNLPILEHIDIADKIKTGNWLLLLYHHDCPDCQKAIIEIEQMARELEGNEDFLRFALIAVPPYGKAGERPVSGNSPCVLGKLNKSKELFVMTPAIVLMTKSKVFKAWEEDMPGFEDILGSLAVENIQLLES